jgi:trigger factor
MIGVRAGQTRTAQAVLTQDAPNEALRGKTVTAQFDVGDVKRLQLPEMNREFLAEIGDFESEAELRDAVRDNLVRQLQYHQRQRAREQITAALTVSANWELPPDLLKRQSQRELERAVMELQRSGFNQNQIRAYENDLRQNSLRVTAKALKEHFILERIAEEEKIEESEQDYDDEIALIAEQSDETPRRIRARLEKAGRMDVLRNQIIERKTVDLILAHAKFHDVPWEPEALEAEAIDRAAGGGDTAAEMPEAKPEAKTEQQS